VTAVNRDPVPTETPSDRELVWTRIFNAPRRLVFDAWTKPELLRRWFAPNGWTLPECDVDLRPGGSYRFGMRSNDGPEMTMRGIYRQVQPPERFVCTQAWEGFSEVGWRPEDECLMTIELTEDDGKTTWKMSLVFPTQEARDAVLRMGMEFERIDQLLADLQTRTPSRTLDLVVTRRFDAPVAHVWSAWTEPEHVMRWWGPTGFTSPLARMDVREGGTSLVCMRSPNGHDFHNTWTYTRVEPMQRLEFVLRFADANGHTIDPASLGLPAELARGVQHTIMFQAHADTVTEMTVTESGYESQQVMEMSRQGLEQCLDKMGTSFA
jgi:uncharacterized protein YndB with AHSA1/START domain